MSFLFDEYGQAESDFLHRHAGARYPEELLKEQGQYLFETKFIQRMSSMDEYLLYGLLAWRRRRFVSTSLHLSLFLNHWIEFKKISPFMAATYLSAARIRVKPLELKNLIESFSNLERFGFARHPNLTGIELILNRQQKFQNFPEEEKRIWLFSAIASQEHTPHSPYPDYWSYDEIWELALDWESETGVPALIFQRFKTADETRSRVLQFFLQQKRSENLTTMKTILLPSYDDCFVCPRAIQLGLESDIPELVQVAAQRKLFYQDPQLDRKRQLHYQSPLI